jgi:hypothetical protein
VVADLRVVGDSLGSLATQMQSAAGLLDNAVSGLAGREGAVGHSGVSSAVAGFERHWGDGRTRVREQAVTLAQVLSDSVATFDEAEAQIAASLDTASSGPVVTGVQVAR